MKNWFFLFIAIASEIVATSALKSSHGFSKLIPSIVVIIGYSAAFYCLSLTLRTIPVGIAYAIWSGIGIVGVSLIAWLYYGQKLDLPAVLGMVLIITGVLIMNLFSKTSAH